jgi:hypothetical protein
MGWRRDLVARDSPVDRPADIGEREAARKIAAVWARQAGLARLERWVAVAARVDAPQGFVFAEVKAA